MSMKVNPKLRLPQKLLNFFITRLTGVFLYLQHKKAVEVCDGQYLFYFRDLINLCIHHS